MSDLPNIVLVHGAWADGSCWSGVIERLRAAGSLPDVDPVSLAFSLAASCQMYFVLAPEVKALSGRNVYLPDEVDRHAQSVVRLFLRS